MVSDNFAVFQRGLVLQIAPERVGHAHGDFRELFSCMVGLRRKNPSRPAEGWGNTTLVRRRHELGRRARSTTGDIHSAGYRGDRARLKHIRRPFSG